MKNKAVDVVIAGAGPCGLMLANELGRRDISVLVLDMEASVASAPQANATQARTMEYFRRLGFAEDVRKLGLPGDHPTDIAYFTTYFGYELARHEMPPSNEAAIRVREIEDVWNGPELPHRIPQSLVEQKLLHEALKCPGVSVDFNRKVTGFEQDSGGVVTNFENTDSGEVLRVRAKYLFAADGPLSIIRKQLGIRYCGGDTATRDFMGGQMLAVYLEAPAFYDVQPNRAWMYWTFNRRRRALLATVDGKGEFALQTQLRPGEDLDSIDEDAAGKLFLQAMGCTIPFKVTGTGSWLAGRALVADQFSRGRVFLGGDAVHLFTPTGGMGYNTAIEDAVNIGWKLAAVIKGQAGAALPDSYETERRPIA